MKSLRTVLAAAAIAVAGITASGVAQASPSGLYYPGYCYGYETKVTHLGFIWRSHWDRVDVYKKTRIGFFCAKIKVYSYFKFHRSFGFPFYAKKVS
jgi:hypothetical protein